MGFGLLAGVLWALDTVVLSKALSFYEALLIAPLVAAFLHDTCSFVYLTFYHGWKKGIKKRCACYVRNKDFGSFWLRFWAARSA